MKRSNVSSSLCILFPLLFASIACSSNSNHNGQSTSTGGSQSTSTGGSDAGSNLQGGSTSTTTDAGSDAQTAPSDLLVDDFEDGDNKPLIPGGWYSYTDGSNGGKSTLTFTGATGSAIVMNGPGYESSKSLEVSYTLDQGTYTYAPYLGFGASIGTAAAPYDLSDYAGISYSYQGGAHRMRVETAEVTDYDVYGVDVPAATSWTTVTLPFANFAQQGWGKKVEFNLSHVLTLSFALTGSTGDTGKLQIDNLKVVGAIAHGGPDMTINPVSPPADGVLTSTAITNPLQAKAVKYLTRGYNITNWLEQAKFTGFTYDESYVIKLSQAGFKSLRLPIDLDLYVATTSGTGSSLSITASQDLFTILDSFNTWTKAHGLSLTIDYHQYSTLLDLSKPDTVATAIQLWGKVAEHFAGEAREDLFFELLNEPELSFAGTAPTQTQWTSIAEQMIAAIRATDKTHTIIFGDVQWYGIAALASLTPLTDTNVIYAFHDYEPFIFTHQGASWANMGSTHDIPYPYNPDRWSQYYSDLGFSQLMGAWILGQAQSYYVNGTHSAVRNQMLNAKRWAVTNNVPVICNEFGAYDGTSRLEDRVRYYADVVGIFDELAIPWQTWFMLMDANGTVIPEYAGAMHLGQ